MKQSQPISFFVLITIICSLTLKTQANNLLMSNQEKVNAAIDTFVNETCFIEPYNLYIDTLDALINLKIDNSNYELFKGCANDIFYKTRNYRINPIGPSADEKYEQRELIIIKLSEIDNKLTQEIYLKEIIEAHRSASNF